MDLIYYRGLNCRLAAIINIADQLGINYLDAFATLWSETEFSDEIKYNIYMSKRVYENLKAIGIHMEALNMNEDDISGIADGERLLIGMDTFDIPWHPVFGHFHDPHYFFAKKETEDFILCSDPVYDEKNIRIQAEEALYSAFELCRVCKRDVRRLRFEPAQEAEAVLRSHPEIAEALLDRIQSCANEGKCDLNRLLKQINAMINNRYLFGHYLRDSALISGRGESFFNEAYFVKWEAVRNGLYKAGAVKDNRSIIDEVGKLFTDAMHEEIDMAKEILEIKLAV